jgi:tetratricopeptide (TPR) repeat protein
MNKKNIILAVVFLLSSVALFFAGRYVYETKFRFAAKTESNMFSLGQIAASKGLHQEAVLHYRELLQKDPKHDIAMRFMLESQLHLNIKDEIISTIDQLIKLAPSKDNLEIAVSASLQVGDKTRAEAYAQELGVLQKAEK